MGVEWSIALSQYRQVREAIAHIAEDGWEPIGYTEDGEAQVAETSFVASKKKGKHRRVRGGGLSNCLCEGVSSYDASMISKSGSGGWLGVSVEGWFRGWLVGFRGVGRAVGRYSV